MIIIHGENITESRKKLDAVLLGKQNIKRQDGKSLKPDILPLLLESTELFAEQKTIVVENCKALPKQSLDLFVNTSIPEHTTIVFWQDGNYDLRNIKKFPQAQVYSYPLPKYYFTFLDNLMPGKAGYLHSLYIELLDTFVPEQLFFSLIKRVRHLLLLKTGLDAESDELIKMNAWQKQKLQTQARVWTISELQALYAELYRTEQAIKSSNLPAGLRIHLDNLLLTTLQ